MAKQPTKLSEQDLAELLRRQSVVEKTAMKMVSVKEEFKAAKAAHEEAKDKVGQFLYSLNNGLPLFDGEEDSEE